MMLLSRAKRLQNASPPSSPHAVQRKWTSSFVAEHPPQPHGANRPWWDFEMPPSAEDPADDDDGCRCCPASTVSNDGCQRRRRRRRRRLPERTVMRQTHGWRQRSIDPTTTVAKCRHGAVRTRNIRRVHFAEGSHQVVMLATRSPLGVKGTDTHGESSLASSSSSSSSLWYSHDEIESFRSESKLRLIDGNERTNAPQRRQHEGRDDVWARVTFQVYKAFCTLTTPTAIQIVLDAAAAATFTVKRTVTDEHDGADDEGEEDEEDEDDNLGLERRIIPDIAHDVQSRRRCLWELVGLLQQPRPYPHRKRTSRWHEWSQRHRRVAFLPPSVRRTTNDDRISVASRSLSAPSKYFARHLAERLAASVRTG